MQVFGAPALDTVQIGGVTFYNVTALIVLSAVITGTATTVKSTFRKPGATAGYQVTLGKTYTVRAIRAHTNGGSNGQFIMGYSDNDVGMAGNTAYTNFVDTFGANTIGNWATSGGVGTIFEHAPFFPVPAQKYMGLLGLGSTAQVLVHAYGYEA